ncbi:MAG TPA: SDR family oxidoreductase [Thermoguttaceae bacterium]|nr:SDR family oxidoreductase [Thermoguttaceae bacterium]
MKTETALITGASSGIGLELAKVFAEDGSNLVLVARRKDRLEALASTLRDEHGIEVSVLAKDLCDKEAPNELFTRLSDDGITVDVVVNNAGFGAVGSFAKLSVQRQMEMVQVNITALTHLTRLFLPSIIERDRGGILNVGSTAAFQPGPRMAIYYATKAYVLSFTEAIAEELAGTNVSVSCLCPGPTTTEFEAEAGMEGLLLFKLGAMDARTVAEMGYRGFRRGKTLVIPGLTNRLGAFGVRLTPRAWVRKIVKRLQSRR